MIHYCPDCGVELEHRHVEGRVRGFCSACDRVHFAQLKVGAGVLVEQDRRLLLLKRRHDPFKGTWNLPAGYCEADEAPEETARREAFEETGLQVDIAGVVGVYFFDDDPRGNGILILYQGEVVGGSLNDTPEAERAAFFPAESVPEDLSGGGHDSAIRTWRAEAAIRARS